MQRGALALVVLAAATAAACGGTKTVTRTVTVAAPPSSGDVVEFGYVKSLVRSGDHFVLRFDPAWLTTGVTASQAKFEDTGSRDVPNDFYLVNEGHRQLTYLVPLNAHAFVLTRGANLTTGTPISVSELARIVNGSSHRKLFEPITTGFWIRIHVDTVRSLKQQYFP
jgi:hypothetical protein